MNSRCLIVIISFNQLGYTKGCTESILKNTDYPYRILIVDNGSNKETVDYLKRIKEQNIAEVIFNKKNIGWVKAVNQGMYYSNSQYVCVMNNDTFVYPYWLPEMVAVAERDKSIGIVNPLWELSKGFKGKIDNYYNKVIRSQRGQFIDTDWARGFCFLVKRTVINKIGGLDEAFSPGYYDDWDYSVRAQESGFRCIRAKGAFVYHYKNITYSEELGQKGLDSILKEKGNVFYRRWGRPLRILMVVDSIFKNTSVLLKDFILYLLKKQNKVFILSSQRDLCVNHTNCIVRKSKSAILRIKVFIKMLDNLRHSHSKRYDIILCSSPLNKFFKKFYFIRNNYIVKELDGNIDNREELLSILSNLKKRGF